MVVVWECSGSGVGSVSLNNCVKCGFGMVMIVCGCGECVLSVGVALER